MNCYAVKKLLDCIFIIHLDHYFDSTEIIKTLNYKCSDKAEKKNGTRVPINIAELVKPKQFKTYNKL